MLSSTYRNSSNACCMTQGSWLVNWNGGLLRQFAFLILLKPVPIPSAYWRHGRALLVHRIYSDPLSSILSSTIYMDSMIAIFAGLSSKQSAQSLQTALPKSAFFKFHPLLDCLLKVLMVSFKIPFGYIWLAV